MSVFSRVKTFFTNRLKADNIFYLRSNYGYSAGTEVTPDTAMKVAAFYRGVIYISSQMAKLPLNIKDGNNKNVYSHNIYTLLNVSPNPEMNAVSFKLLMYQTALISGNGYAEIERSMDGRIKALWPINPNRVIPQRTTEGELIFTISGGGPQGETIYLRPDEILIFRNLHTKNGILGEGLVSFAMDTLGISLAANGMANSLYANGGMPSGVLTYPGKFSPEAFDRLFKSWKEGHGGRKTGSTAILENGVMYSPISHNPQVLQFLESRQFGVIEIARFLGVPPTMLFDSASAKFNNVEQQNLQVVTDVLDAHARNTEAEIDMKLLYLQRGGFRAEFNLYAIFRGDMVTRSTYFKNMVSIGAMSPNEVREEEGREGYAGGNRYYISTNNFTPQDRMDEIIDAEIEQKTAKNELAAPDETDDGPSEAEEELARAAAQYLTKV